MHNAPVRCLQFFVSCFARGSAIKHYTGDVGKQSIVCFFYFLSNASTKNYHNRIVYVNIVASGRWHFFETQCVQCEFKKGASI